MSREIALVESGRRPNKSLDFSDDESTRRLNDSSIFSTTSGLVSFESSFLLENLTSPVVHTIYGSYRLRRTFTVVGCEGNQVVGTMEAVCLSSSRICSWICFDIGLIGGGTVDGASGTGDEANHEGCLFLSTHFFIGLSPFFGCQPSLGSPSLPPRSSFTARQLYRLV